MSIEDRLKSQARTLGFDLVGIARLGPAETAPMFEEWLSRGFAGDMSYLERGAEKRADPQRSAFRAASQSDNIPRCETRP